MGRLAVTALLLTCGVALADPVADGLAYLLSQRAPDASFGGSTNEQKVLATVEALETLRALGQGETLVADGAELYLAISPRAPDAEVELRRERALATTDRAILLSSGTAIRWWFLSGDITVRFNATPLATLLGQEVGTPAWAEEESPRRGSITLTPLAGFERFRVWLARSNHALGRTGLFQPSTPQLDSWGALLGHEVSQLAGLEQSEESIANDIDGLFTGDGPKLAGETTVDIQ